MARIKLTLLGQNATGVKAPIKQISNIKKIIVYGDKFLIYEKGKTKNPNLCDDNLILGCIYNNFQNDLITFSHKRVKLWDIYTGKVKIIFEDPKIINNNDFSD